MVDGHFGLHVTFRLKPGAAEGFDALAAQTIEQILATEPGTLVYVSHCVRDRPDVRVFYELYHDREAFEAHESMAHTRRFLAEREQYLDGVDVDFLTSLAEARRRE